MNARGRWAALAVGISAAVAVGVALPDGTPSGDAMDGRTPIDVASLGPQVGEQVPDFSLPDQYGETRTLESVLGSNGAMLLFHRSADW